LILFFEPAQSFQNRVKGCGLLKEHVPHLLIIPFQLRQARGWRHEPECSWHRQIVSRPTPGEEP